MGSAGKPCVEKGKFLKSLCTSFESHELNRVRVLNLSATGRRESVPQNEMRLIGDAVYSDQGKLN